MALLQAMEIAADKGISNVKYIQAILVNSNGRVERKEKNEYGSQDNAAIVDELLRQADESLAREREDSEEVPSYIHVRGTW
jgi:hypothetical protein